jgi:hypothetical protein
LNANISLPLTKKDKDEEKVGEKLKGKKSQRNLSSRALKF